MFTIGGGYKERGVYEMRRKKEGQTYEIKNRMRPSGCPKCGRRIMDVSLDTKMRFVTPKKGRHPYFIIKCWHCGAEIGVVKQNSERWTRSEPEGRELTGDTATAIRQSHKECIWDRETDG